MEQVLRKSQSEAAFNSNALKRHGGHAKKLSITRDPENVPTNVRDSPKNSFLLKTSH